MALQQQEIIYNLGIGGVDQKTDAKFAPLGRPTELANVRFPKTGTIAKRYGLAPGSAAQTNTIQRILALGDEALMVGKTPAGVRAWFSRFAGADGGNVSAGINLVGTSGTNVPAVPRAWVDGVAASKTVVADEITGIDAAIGLTQTCYVYRVGNGDAYYAIFDNSTGRKIAEVKFASTTGNFPLRALAIPGSNAFVVAAVSTTPAVLVRMVAADTTTGTGTTLDSTNITINANGTWDWALFGSTIIMAYRTSAATTLTVTKFPASSTSLGGSSSSSPLTMTTGPDKVAVCAPYASTEDAVILVHDTTNGLRGLTVSTSALTIVQSLWVINSTLTVRNHISGARLANGSLFTTSEMNDATNYQVFVRTSSGTIGGAGTSADVNGYLCSKPILTSASVTPFFVIGHLSRAGTGLGLQHARVLLEGTKVVGIFLRGDADTPPTTNGVPFVPNVSSMPGDTDIFGSPVVEHMCPTIRIVRRIVDEAGGATIRGAAAMRFNVHPSSGYVAVQDEGTLLISGGFLSLYDGTTVTENGFLFYPEIVSVTPSNGAGTLPVNGTFRFCACFVRIDSRGRIHRSAPSEVVDGTTGATDDTFTITVRGLPFTQMAAYGIEVYRTENEGSIFYLAEAQLDIGQSGGGATFNFTITGADTALIANTPLGQQQGILDNEQPLCPIGISSNGRRILVTPGDDRFSVVESKERVEGEGAAFFGSIQRRITQDNEITGLENVGERWVAFKKRRIYLASGEGADDTGQSDTLSEFEAHPMIGVGVSHARAYVRTPYGIVFRSEKGYYLLESSGGIAPLGVAIDDYKDFPLVSASFHEDRNEVHFLLLDGPRLVLSIHETEAGPSFRWSVDQDSDSADHYADIAVVGGLLYAAPENRNSSDNYEIFVEEIGQYGDQGSQFPVVMRVTTGWIPIAGRNQGRGRLYSAKFLGDVFGGPHTARVRVAYDYRDEWIDDKSITAANATAGGEAPYQWEFRPAVRQKCQAVRFEFTETIADASRGCELNQLMLTVGVQPGSKTLRSTQRATAT